MAGVKDHQVRGIKTAPDIIYPNGYELFQMVQIIEGLTTTTNDYGFTVMSVLKRCQGIYGIQCLSRTSPFISMTFTILFL
jgi:hypothetical protein